MTIEGGSTEVAQGSAGVQESSAGVQESSAGVQESSAGVQEIQIIPKKREFVQGILNGTGCAPCETFDVEKKGEALRFLINPDLLRDKEFSNVESWQEYFQSISNDPLSDISRSSVMTSQLRAEKYSPGAYIMGFLLQIL